MKDTIVSRDVRGGYAPRRPRRGADETVNLGREIYKRDIRDKVEPDHIGEYVAIDVDSGCWALGEKPMAARNRLGDMRPEAVDVSMEKIGYEAPVGFGGAPRRSNWSWE